MALQKQLIPFTITQGLDTKTDEKVSSSGFLELINAVQINTGSIQKRPGFELLGANTGAVTPDIRGLATFNSELFTIADRGYFSYRQSTGVHQRQTNTTLTPNTATTATVAITNRAIADGDTHTLVGSATLGSYSCVIWVVPQAGTIASVLKIRVFDDLTGLQIFASQLNSTTTTGFVDTRVIAAGTSFVIMYLRTNGANQDLNGYSINPTTLINVAPVAVMATVAGGHWDAHLGNGTGRVVVAYRTTLNKIAKIEVAATLVTSLPVTTVLDCVGTVRLSIDSATSNLFVLRNASATTWALNALNSAGTLLAGASTNGTTTTSVTSLTLGPCVNGTISMFTNATNNAGLLGQYSQASYNASGITSGIPSLSAVVPFFVVSRPFLLDGAEHIMVMTEDLTVSGADFQRKYFLLNPFLINLGIPDSLVGKALDGVAGGVGYSTPRVRADGKVAIAVTKQTRLVGSSGTTPVPLLNTYELIIQSKVSSSSAQLGGNLHFTRGHLRMYDGANVVEHGFHSYPAPCVLTGGGAATSVPVGTFQYCAVWEWVDSAGQIHQSAPSIPVSITNTVARDVQVTVPRSSVLQKPGSLVNGAAIAIYRTNANGTNFYRVDTPTSRPGSVGDNWVLTDNVTDTTLMTRQLLYTTGGVLENVAPPPCTIVTKVKNRLFTNSTDNPSRFHFSKEYRPGEGVAFASEFYFDLPDNDIVQGFAALDGRTIIFGLKQPYAITGQGPTDDGSDPFSLPEGITASAGCVEPRSIVAAEFGVMFKSAKGIYLLDRGLNLTYIGAAVERFNTLTITSAVNLPDLNQIRFTTSSNRTLVYDYYHKQWYTFVSNAVSSIAAAVSYNGLMVTASGASSNNIFRETPTLYSDNGQPIPYTIKLPWLSLAGIQGYQRIYGVQFLGNLIGAHTLNVRLSYDFTPYSVNDEIVSIDPTTALALDPASETMGSVYQFEVKPAQQKCETVQLTITDSFAGGSTGTASFSLSALTFEIGVEGKRNRLPATRRLS